MDSVQRIRRQADSDHKIVERLTMQVRGRFRTASCLAHCALSLQLEEKEKRIKILEDQHKSRERFMAATQKKYKQMRNAYFNAVKVCNDRSCASVTDSSARQRHTGTYPMQKIGRKYLSRFSSEFLSFAERCSLLINPPGRRNVTVSSDRTEKKRKSSWRSSDLKIRWAIHTRCRRIWKHPISAT
eukprot:GHVU01154508.1.p1 GENE.GHVU01154508.1~~GHVU01154508.1.p1  ORF type:complete len:185 (-),score=12.18 GHVU01154508.1:1740-2294(-)